MVARVPIMQLARSKGEGGLNLQIPAMKCKSLAINRHLKDINSIPFYRSLLFHANPRPPISFDLPDIKMILIQLSNIPLHIQSYPSNDQIHKFFIQQTELPKVEQNFPEHDWPNTWRNIAMKQLTSETRSKMYLLVNGKIEHRKLLYTMRRAPDELCTHCGTHEAETLVHKFSACDRVAPAWTVLQQRITGIMNGWRRLPFEDLVRPALAGVNKRRRVEIIKVFTRYISFVSECNNSIDLDVLKFLLDF
jgi:hypothetical protein